MILAFLRVGLQILRELLGGPIAYGVVLLAAAAGLSGCERHPSAPPWPAPYDGLCRPCPAGEYCPADCQTK
jgi:hypothetical protein